MNSSRVQQTLAEINKFGGSANGINRLAYTREDEKAREYLSNLCVQEGLKVRIDDCGNLIARREGLNPNLPAVACGSHLDTVCDGGKYDGTVGVVAILEVIRSLNEKKLQTEHPIELISFACEESSRFGVSTIGSKAMAGLIDIENLKKLRDKNGIGIEQAFADCGLNFDNIENAKRNCNELKAFIEVHIEQGSTLENEKKKIGLVTGIAAPTRLKVLVKGKAAHSGSTSMYNRKDALLGASEIALQLEEIAKSEAYKGTVATVGVLDVQPGAMNVVPGSVEMYIDIRGTSKNSKEIVFSNLLQYIKYLEKKRDLQITWEILSKEEPILLDKSIIECLRKACAELGISYMEMPSGAGHDVMNMATICPAGLIFVPSKDGLSHHPDEYTDLEDIMLGIQVLEKVIVNLANPKTTNLLQNTKVTLGEELA